MSLSLTIALGVGTIAGLIAVITRRTSSVTTLPSITDPLVVQRVREGARNVDGWSFKRLTWAH